MSEASAGNTTTTASSSTPLVGINKYFERRPWDASEASAGNTTTTASSSTPLIGINKYFERRPWDASCRPEAPLPSQQTEKRKRTDRSIKCTERKDKDLTVVKATLRRYLKGTNAFVDRFVEAVNSRVQLCSKNTVHASLSMAGIVKSLLDGQDVATAPLPPNLFEQTFSRQLMLGVDDAAAPEPAIVAYHSANPELQPSGQRHAADRNIYSSAAKRYLTNLKNAMRVEGTDRLRTFCHRFATLHNLKMNERIGMMYAIAGWRTLPAKFGCPFPATRIMAETITEHRNVLGLVGNKEINKDWLRRDACLPRLLRYNVLLNRFYETHQMKLHNVVPICRVKRHFISIDNYSLYGILKDVSYFEAGVNEAAYLQNVDMHWNCVFRISALQGCNTTFGYSIETDGISMCMHFERPKRQTTKAMVLQMDGKKPTAPPYSMGPDDVLLGNDPGRINIYYMATEMEDGSIWSSTLSRKQYYAESGILQARKTSETWNGGVQTHLDALSTVSTKGADLTTYRAYLAVYYAHRDALWAEYCKPRWSRQRLRLYGGKKRTFAHFFNRVEAAFPGKRIVVSYGSAKFAPGGKNEVSVPTSRAYKECVYRAAKVLVTNEFRTSKIDYFDDSLLQMVALPGANPRPFRGLLWSVQRNEFVSRDLNAALNIRRCAIHRPDILRSDLATAQLRQRIAKRIKRRV